MAKSIMTNVWNILANIDASLYGTIILVFVAGLLIAVVYHHANRKYKQSIMLLEDALDGSKTDATTGELTNKEA